VPTDETILYSLIPHTPMTPKEVCPFFTQQCFNCPTSLPKVSNNRLDMKSLSPTTNVHHTIEQFSAILSPREYAHKIYNLFATTNLSPRETARSLSLVSSIVTLIIVTQLLTIFFVKIR
jgi:hypothetical protein